MATKSDFIVKSGIRVAANATITGNVSANVFSGNGAGLTSVNAALLNSKTESNLNVNSALTSNNSSYLNTKTEANLNVNNALTSNNASYLGGTIASGYQTTAGLSANVATLTANSANYVKANNGITSNAFGVFVIQGDGTVVNATGVHVRAGNTQLVSNSTGVWVDQTKIDHNLLSNYVSDQHVAHSTVSVTAGAGLTGGGTIAASRTLDVGAGNGIAVDADSVRVVAGTDGGLVSNSTGVFVTAGQGLITNSTGVHVGVANGITGAADSIAVTEGVGLVVNTTGVHVKANNGITANTSGAFVTPGTGIVVNATGVHVNQTLSLTTLTTTGNATIGGNLTVTGNVTVLGANNLSIVDNFIYLNSNNTTQNIDIGFAGNYNDGTYKHTGFFRDATDGYWKPFDSYLPEPDAAVDIDTSNSSFNIAGMWVGSSRIGNTTVYATINSTAYSGSANNATNLNGQPASYYTNATNISTGTLSYAQIPANIINTTAAFTRTGITTFSANVVLGSSGLSANGGFGTAGHTLHSNGTATYWAADDQGVTSVATGNGLTGGTITTTGTISVVANNGLSANATGVYVVPGNGIVTTNSTGVHVGAGSGITVNTTAVAVLANTGVVANATGTYVNAQYIATIASNSATYANSSITNTFTVGTASYFVSNGNLGVGNSTPVHKLRVEGTSSLAGAVSDITTLAAGNTTITGFANVSGNGQFNGNVGIGTAPLTSAGLTVSKTWTTDLDLYTQLSYGTDSNTSLTAARTKATEYNFLYNYNQQKSSDGLTTYNSAHYATISAAFNGNPSTGGDAFSSTMEGTRSVVYQYANGANANTINLARAAFSFVQTLGSGVITSAYGAHNQVAIGNNSVTGNITSAFGTRSQIISNTSATITTGYLYYGDYLGATTTTKYGMYLTGETTNYLSGNVGIGNTAPTNKLSVNGTTFLGANLTITPTAAVIVNNTSGAAGDVLTSNGTAVYWAAAAAGVNTAAQYTWTNTHTFTSNVTIGNTTTAPFLTSQIGLANPNTFTHGTVTVTGINMMLVGPYTISQGNTLIIASGARVAIV